MIAAFRNRSRLRLGLGASVLASGLIRAQAPPPQLPPPPVPSENPISEAKRILGKVLFWDEQLSSNGTISCGGCHRPGNGGGDPRVAVNPGLDSVTPSADDILGSPGVVHADASGLPVDDPVFGAAVQVTARAANSFLMAPYAPELFWDGRARSTFTDPESGSTSIVSGGALESQATGPILNHAEMARDARTWSDVRGKLARSLPLGDATDLPPDVSTALAGGASYPDLFQNAFGDGAISAERIAWALATYERTLVPNQSPWDRFVAGDAGAMSAGQVNGWNFFRNSPCSICHTPPFFTNQSFRNIGIRPPAEDLGRQNVSGLVQDRGRFKVPTLRNVGLKATHMHNGRIATVNDSVLWYRPNNPQRSADNLDPILPVGVPPQVLPALVDFLQNALTDPRVAAETTPFDRPRIHGGNLPVVSFATDRVTLSWPLLEGVQRYYVYRGSLASLHDLGPDGAPSAGFGTCLSTLDPNTADASLVDNETPNAGEGFFYLKSVVDGSGTERGLGATSEGRPRTVLASCTGP